MRLTKSELTRLRALLGDVTIDELRRALDRRDELPRFEDITSSKTTQRHAVYEVLRHVDGHGLLVVFLEAVLEERNQQVPGLGDWLRLYVETPRALIGDTPSSRWVWVAVLCVVLIGGTSCTWWWLSRPEIVELQVVLYLLRDPLAAPSQRVPLSGALVTFDPVGFTPADDVRPEMTDADGKVSLRIKINRREAGQRTGYLRITRAPEHLQSQMPLRTQSYAQWLENEKPRNDGAPLSLEDRRELSVYVLSVPDLNEVAASSSQPAAVAQPLPEARHAAAPQNERPVWEVATANVSWKGQALGPIRAAAEPSVVLIRTMVARPGGVQAVLSTGLVVAPRTVLTTRFEPPMAQVVFPGELTIDGTTNFSKLESRLVERFLFHDPRLGVALLDVPSLDLPPVAFAKSAPFAQLDGGSSMPMVAVLGYSNERGSWKKRLMPGLFVEWSSQGDAGVPDAGGEVDGAMFVHDAWTSPGSEGSVVLDVGSNTVVGLHRDGKWVVADEKRNRAIPFSTLLANPGFAKVLAERTADAGVP